MRAPLIPLSHLPRALRTAPPETTPCGRCKKPIFWGRHSDADERPFPVEPEPNNSGSYLIDGFVEDQYGASILPRMADVRNPDLGLPDWDALPEWTHRKRWTNHAAACRTSLAAATTAYFEYEPPKPVNRVGLAESRGLYVDEMLIEVKKIVPSFISSERFTRACAAFREMRIDRSRFNEEMLREAERIGIGPSATRP